jgi:hypothetical protein
MVIAATMALLGAAALPIAADVRAEPPARPMSALSNSLVAYWTLDEQNGNRADSVGGNTLTDNNSTGYNTGVIGNAAETDFAAHRYLSAPDSASLSTGGTSFSMTFAVWVNLNDKTQVNYILSKNNSLDYDIYYSVGANRFRFCYGGTLLTGNCINADSLGSPSTGVWYYVVGWYDASADTLNIQVNDGTIDSSGSTLEPSDSSGSFYIGKEEYSPSYSDARIDEVGIWKRTLTSAERSALYNLGAGCAYPFTTCDVASHTFATSYDNWLDSSNPSTNYGAYESLIVGDASTITGGLQSSRSVIRFPIDVIPPGADVLSATLSLTTKAAPLGCSGNRTIDLYLVKSNWSETQSTWTRRLIEWDDALQTNITRDWSTAGAGSSEQVQPSTASATAGETADQVLNFDVAADVRKLVSGGQLNYGWVLQDRNEAAGCQRIFHSYDSAVSSARPALTISYTINDYSVDSNWLQDGQFEDGSTAWEYAGGATRRQSDLDFSSNNVGPAVCGTYYATIDGGYNAATDQATALRQRFYWPGGVAYFHSALHANGNDSHQFSAVIKLERVDGTLPAMTAAWIVSQNLSTTAWTDYHQTLPLGAGWWDLTIGSTDGGQPNIADFAIDDITIALNQYMTYCLGPGGPTRTPRPTYTMTPTTTRTPTSTAGASPTPTNTPSVSPTPSRTPTPSTASNFGNCDFEGGSAGWAGSDWSLGNAGGPIGPRYAIITGSISQQFSWAGGVAYFTFWVGPGSYGSISVRNLSTNQSITLHTPASPASWQLRTATANLPAGTYRVEASGNGSTIKIDGVMVAANGYAYCGSGSGPITPTNGPTSYVTATSTPTPNGSLSPTPSATATASRTPTKTMTPYPTNTAGPTNTPIPTNTQVATHTQIATSTQSGAEQTATAQGTEIPTYTPYPTLTPYPTFTPYPTATPYTPPPEQPPPAWNADCQQPQGLDPAGWAGYYQCQALSWFSWGPGNTQQLIDLMSRYSDRGPFGAISEVSDTIGVMRDLLNSQDWSTGPDYGAEDTSVFTNPSGSIYDGSGIGFRPGSYGSSCDIALPGAGGAFIKGICWALAFLAANKFLPYFQWAVNGGAIILFLAYIVKAWIAKASQA